MSNLVSVADVRAIMEVPDEVSSSQLDAFISDAHIVVSEDLAGKGLSATRLAAIEKYLAAHFALQLTERGGFTSSRIGDARDDYVALSPQGQDQIAGFSLTRYGQQAITLDTSGTLKTMSNAKLGARFRLVGRTATYEGYLGTEAAEVERF